MRRQTNPSKRRISQAAWDACLDIVLAIIGLLAVSLMFFGAYYR